MNTTTEPARHGTDAAAPPTAAASGVEELTTAECWRLLEASRVGRIAIATAEGRPELFPINYAVHDGNLYFRSAPGTKLMRLAQRPAVAFEIDGSDDHHYWSVIVSANARRLDTDAEIEASGVLRLPTLTPTPKHNYVRLTPVDVTGRRFQRHPLRTTATAPIRTVGAVKRTDQDDAPPVAPKTPDTKPTPIPHLAPSRPREGYLD